jgi:hypothetical protein
MPFALSRPLHPLGAEATWAATPPGQPVQHPRAACLLQQCPPSHPPVHCPPANDRLEWRTQVRMPSSWLSPSNHVWLSSYVCTAHRPMLQAVSIVSPGGSKVHVSRSAADVLPTHLLPPQRNAPGFLHTSGSTWWLRVDGSARGRRPPPLHPGRPTSNVPSLLHVAPLVHLLSEHPRLSALAFRMPRSCHPLTHISHLSMPL